MKQLASLRRAYALNGVIKLKRRVAGVTCRLRSDGKKIWKNFLLRRLLNITNTNASGYIGRLL
jgi:hypothetical protein